MEKFFIGKSGKFYAKNPFGSTLKYTYAVYNSKDAYLNMEHLPTYTNEETAMNDFKEDVTITPIMIKSKRC